MIWVAQPAGIRRLRLLIQVMRWAEAVGVVRGAEAVRVLPGDGVRPPAGGERAGEWTDVALSDALDQYERALIARALSAAHGNVAEAARRLATDRANLYRRMRRLGIEPPRNMTG